MTVDQWQPTACILCGVQLRHRGADRRTASITKIRGDKDHPASQGYTVQQGAATRPLPEQRQPARPHRCGARPDGSYEEIDWDTAISEIAAGFLAIRDHHGGDKIFYYGGGGQGNHLGGAYSGAFLKAIGSRYRSNALAQEKTGEAWVDAYLYGGHTRGEFEHAEVSVFVGKNPVDVAEFPTGQGGAQRDRQGSGPRHDRHRPGDHRHRQAGRLPSAGTAGTDAWCLAAMAAVLMQENLCDEAFLAAHVNGVERGPRRAGAGTDRRLRAAVRRRRKSLIRQAVRRIACSRQRGGVRGSRHPAGTQQHAVLLPQQDAVDPHR